MDRQEFLTMTDLMNYHYCNRITFFENVMKVRQTITIKEKKGWALHDRFSQKSKRNKIVKEFPKLQKEYNLHLSSEDLNFRTILDCLLIDKRKGEAFPIEYKDAKRPQKLYWTFKIQIFAESLLVRNAYGYLVPCGFIKFEQTGDLEKIKITKDDLSKVKETIEQINKIVQTEVMPEPTTFTKRCKDCCYWKICRRA